MHRGPEGHNPFARAVVQGKKADARCTDTLLAAARARRSYAVAVILLACLMLLAGSRSPAAAAPPTVRHQQVREEAELPQQQVQGQQQEQEQQQQSQQENLEQAAQERAQEQAGQRRRRKQRQQQQQQQEEEEQEKQQQDEQEQQQEQEPQQQRQRTRGRGKGHGIKTTRSPEPPDGDPSPAPPRRRPRSLSPATATGQYDDVARMIVQLHGWYTFDGFSDDPSEQMLVVLAGRERESVVPSMWRTLPRVTNHFARLSDFPSAKAAVPERGNPPPATGLQALLQSIPERIDITTLVFHAPTRLTAASAASLEQLSRVTQLMTSLSLKAERRWCVLLKSAGYQLVSEDSQFKTWELVRRT